MNFEHLLKKCNEIYLSLKMKQHPYTAPEALPQKISSTQIQAVLIVLAQELENIQKQITEIKEITSTTNHD